MRLNLKEYIKPDASNCAGCKHAKKSEESFRGIDCTTGLFRECKPDLPGWRKHWEPVDGR